MTENEKLYKEELERYKKKMAQRTEKSVNAIKEKQEERIHPWRRLGA